jgi:hypothetical protein
LAVLAGSSSAAVSGAFSMLRNATARPVGKYFVQRSVPLLTLDREWYNRGV